MEIKLKSVTYKGIADGTSLTYERCCQILSIYDLVQGLGNQIINYKGLQEKVADESLLGYTTIGESAIRTIFPIMAKLGFVDYRGNFMAKNLFTELGHVFINTFRALKANKEQENPNKALDIELCNCICLLKRYGILLMNGKPEYSQHGLWLACAILKKEQIIFWPEFLFILYLIQERSMSLEDALKQAKENRNKHVSYDYYNDDDKPIASTSYSYTHALLLEAGIVEDIQTNQSRLIGGINTYLNLMQNYYE